MHIRSILSVTLLSTLLSSACSESKKEEAVEPTPKPAATAEIATPVPAAPAPAPTASHELTDIGYVIETPADWEFTTLGEATYNFGIKPVKTASGMSIMPSLTIIRAPLSLAPSTVEAAGKRCSGKLLDTGTAENTAVFQNCETEMAGAKILKAEYFLKQGETIITCSASGLDMETMNKACGSMQKK